MPSGDDSPDSLVGVVVAAVAVVIVVSSVIHKGNPSPGARALGSASPLPVSLPAGANVCLSAPRYLSNTLP